MNFRSVKEFETRASYRSLISDLYGELFTRKKIFILISSSIEYVQKKDIMIFSSLADRIACGKWRAEF